MSVTTRLDAMPGPCAICRSGCRGRVCGDCLARFTAPGPRCRRRAISVPAGLTACG